MRELKRKLAIVLSVSMILIGVMPAYAAVIPEEEIEEVVEVAEAEKVEAIEVTEVVEEIAEGQITEDTETISEEEIVDEETSETDMLGDAPLVDPFYFRATAGEATVCISVQYPSSTTVELKYATSSDGVFHLSDFEPYDFPGGTYELGDRIKLKEGECLSFIASDSNPVFSRDNGYGETDLHTFVYEGNLEVKGKIAYLLASSGEAAASKNCFRSAFSNWPGYSGSLVASDLILLADTAPSCYQYMFGGNSLLTAAPNLGNVTLATDCYASMFSGCASLTNAPQLPARELADGCYRDMFNGCTSLTQAPELPATDLAVECYDSMFKGCTSLTEAPELPAEILPKGCYYEMFYGCTNLTSVNVRFTDWNEAGDSTEDWLDDVSDTGTFLCPNELTTDVRDDSHIPAGWNVIKTGEQRNVSSSSGRSTTLFTGTWGNPVTNGVWNYYLDTDIWTYTYIRLFRNTWGYITNPWNNNEPAWFYFDSTGKMLTGWQQLYWNGSLRWFYFHDLKDGHRGECQLGGITPDGYVLDNNGCLIE